MNARTLLALIFIVIVRDSFSQGTFQNLDFEAANLTGYAPGSVSVPPASAFPGWQAFIGSSAAQKVAYDNESTGAPSLSIVDNKNGFVPIQGNYTAFLQSANNPIQTASVSLTQTGVVPSGAQSIQLSANQEQFGSFVVTLGGSTITMAPLQTFPNYTVYGGNVSAWAGQDVTLDITELPPSNGAYSPNLLQLDNILFSPNAVPEPSPFVLSGIAGLLFAAYRRFAPKG